MNLNKYHATGRLYTDKGAADRAVSFYQPRFVCAGYKRQVDNDPASKTFGMQVPEATVKPYNIGRNADKRAIKAARAVRGISK